MRAWFWAAVAGFASAVLDMPNDSELWLFPIAMVAAWAAVDERLAAREGCEP